MMLAAYFAFAGLSMWILGTMGLELPPTYSLRFMLIGMTSPLIMLVWIMTWNVEDTEKQGVLRGLKIAILIGIFFPVATIDLMNLAAYLSCALDGFCS